MQLKTIEIQLFKNIVDVQRIEIEHDVTCFVGKNESGKTTILKALHRLNPANGTSRKFDVTTEYPRWRLAKDRRSESLEEVVPITAEFSLDEIDFQDLAKTVPFTLPSGTMCKAARQYDNSLAVWLSCELRAIIELAATEALVDHGDLQELLACASLTETAALAKEKARSLREASEPLKAKALATLEKAISNYEPLLNRDRLPPECTKALTTRLPKFFYFSSYSFLPGECNLTELAAKMATPQPLLESEQTVVALLAHAGESPSNFLDADYNSRKAELQAASVDLSQNVFDYWKQNTDLEVVFDTDNVVDPSKNNAASRILKIELRDGRHGNVETNFSTRSTGFQWFFSFFAAFSEYKTMDQSLIVLLDEPGTSLHGEAQKDFVRFVFEELGASKQTLYTTHSQFMIDPTRYEKLRAVHDSATREDHNKGVIVSSVSLSADRDTVLPIESALGYSISQHLFIGSGQHLVLEGSSDFVYLQRMTEYLASKGQAGLDPRLAMIPVGSIDNMPAFVALLGRRLKVSVLVDGIKTSNRVDRIKAAARSNGVPESCIVACSQADPGLPDNADIEDLFAVEDYCQLYNWAFGTSVQPGDLPVTSEPVLRKIEIVRGSKFDHALPAHVLTERRAEFFASINAETVARFTKLFELLNGTIMR